MTEFFKYASDSPWLAFFMFCIFVMGAANVLCFAINRPLRHLNIWKHGYPPPHCDADGDPVESSRGDGGSRE